MASAVVTVAVSASEAEVEMVLESDSFGVVG